jgi:undecaprenyl-diphosphatase
LAFDAVLQLATALAVLIYFRKDILVLLKNVFAKVKDPFKTKLTWCLIVGTIPAVIAGLYLQDYMETVFRSPQLVALTLVIGAVIMFAADRVLVQRA